MRTDRLMAALLIGLCLAAAIGTWVVHPARNTPELALTGTTPLSVGTPQIAVFDLYGEISDGAPGSAFGSATGGVSSSRIIPLLRKAARDGVKVILLRVNSPGGTAAASAAIYEELMRIRKAGKTKIVASFGDVAASGAYYLSSAANVIVAQPSTMTGSIGVIAHAMNLQGLMGKLGVSEIAFKSGAHKDILSPYRAIDPTERAMMQHMVDEIYQQFLLAVSTARPEQLPMAKLKPLADGRVYTGIDALKLGLVDKLGTFEDAKRIAAKLAGIKGEPTTRDYTGQSILDSLFKTAASWSGGLHVDLGPDLSHLDRVPLTLLQ